MSKKVQFTRRANGEGSVYQIKDGRSVWERTKKESGSVMLKQARRSKKPSTK